MFGEQGYLGRAVRTGQPLRGQRKGGGQSIREGMVINAVANHFG